MNLDIFTHTFANFNPTTPKLSQAKPNNCPDNCQAQIKGLPWWSENKPFWTYQCKCCQTYQFKEGQVTKGDIND